MGSQEKRMGVEDPTSYSEPEKCVMKHLDWNVSLDFEAHTVSGMASLTFEKKSDSLEQLLLDIRDLKIESVQFHASKDDLNFKIDNPTNVDFGSRLSIDLPSLPTSSFTVDIVYSTSPDSTALQWMTPQQTAGKRQPYLYSQCQAIHARSLYPCQDTPAARFTYKAQVSAPKEMTVLMSANHRDVSQSEGTEGITVTDFSMDIPIPSYLLAIVAGDLEFREIGPRTKVWSEKEMVEKAAYEFAETETMIQVAEELMGPYLWGRYDLLVLPPSFPYGGMENPCLTFVTPTLLAGDRSLVSVVAHEISHSWTGNLVTNANFEHFWLNEGHTVFLERKIHSKLYGEPRRQLHAHAGWTTLKKTVKTLSEDMKHPDYTKLVPDLCGVDPDDAFSSVPYEKGFALLQHLETLLGGPSVFNVFLRNYIEQFKFQSIYTKDWKDFLFSYFKSDADQKKLNNVDWEKWFYGEGLPPYTPHYDLSAAEASHKLSERWINSGNEEIFSADDIKDMSSAIIVEFLSLLLEAKLPLTNVQRLETTYNFHAIKNSEIRFKWLQLCIQARWSDAVEHVFTFLNEQGRMKFVIPLYRSMNKWEEGCKAALENFKSHRVEMHSTTAKKVEDIFNS